MASSKEPKQHHWWPVGLQRYWGDEAGYVSWIVPDGSTEKKRFKNRQIGQKRRGHILFRGSVWQSNFEGQFSIDSKIHDIVEAIIALAPDGHEQGALKHYHIDDQTNRDLTLFILSLLVRSPSQRNVYELYPTLANLPPNEDVGKANMSQQYRIARRLCETGIISNRHFTFLHSEEPTFICGDGCLDWLSASLMANRINGRALIAITPHLCVYINTPMMMRTNRNCAAIRATPSMINRANGITQIYSKEQLFFLGSPPELTTDFQRGKFLQHATFTDGLLTELDALKCHSDGRPGFWRAV